MTARLTYAQEETIRTAIHGGDMDGLRAALGIEGGVRPKADDPACLFALFLAAADDNIPVVDLLLTRGLNANLRGPGLDATALHVAAKNGALFTVRRLLKEHADKEVREKGTQHTPLMRAAMEGHSGAIRMLAEAGADINATRFDGKTALALAAIAGQADCVKFLLERGADRDLRDNQGHDAQWHADQQSLARPQAARLLRGYYPIPTGQKMLPAPPRHLTVPKPDKPLKPLPSPKPPGM